jgi:hypothetical protein
MNSGGGIAGYVPNPYIVNLNQLNGTVTTASGLDPLTVLSNAVTGIESMVNVAQKRLYVNTISKYDKAPVTFLDGVNLSNSGLYSNGVLVNFSGGASASFSSGTTAINLYSTTNISSPAIAFSVGGRNIFSFNGAGQALYYDASGTGNQFWVSSATMIADKIQIGGARLGAAPGKVLTATDVSGTGIWSWQSTLSQGPGFSAFVSSSGFYVGSALSIDPRRNLYLGSTAITGNGDLASSNDVTVIGGGLRIRGGRPAIGSLLYIADALGNIGYSSVATSISSFVIGDQIASGLTSVATKGSDNSIRFDTAGSEVARITAAGYLGLGTALPVAPLDINGSAVVRGSLYISTAAAVPGYFLQAATSNGQAVWGAPQSIFDGARQSWSVSSGTSSIHGAVLGKEVIRISTGGTSLGYNVPLGTYDLNVNGPIHTTAVVSQSTLKFYTAGGATQVMQFLNNGNVGIGVTNPTNTLEIAGTQSNTGNIYSGGNIYATTFYGSFSGNGAQITNIAANHVGSGSGQLDVFEAKTLVDSGAAQIAISSLYNNIAILDAALVGQNSSTISASIAVASNALSIGIVITAGNQVALLSTSVGASLSTSVFRLSTNTYTTASTLDQRILSTVRGGLAIGYGPNAPAVGVLDVSGQIYAKGLHSYSSPFGLGIGNSTTALLSQGGYTPGTGWKFQVQGDIDISGYIYRNGVLLTGMGGLNDLYWGKNGSNLFYSDGNVGIGVISPSYPLDVAGRIRCFGVDIIQGPGSGGGGGGGGGGGNTSTSQGSYIQPWLFQSSNIYYPYGGVGVGYGIQSVKSGHAMDVSGNLYVTGTVTAGNFLASSDRRLKSNVETLLGADDILAGMRGVRFRWTGSGLSDIGVIAQEVQSVLPEAVMTDSSGHLQVSYHKMIPVLIEALKNLTTRVNFLEKEMDYRRR